MRATILFGVLLTIEPGSFLFAQTTDIVVTRRPGAVETVKRRGTITQWQGDSLTLSNDSRDRQIDNGDIVEIQTTWPTEYTAGLNSLKNGDVESAIAQIQSALSIESRPWAQRTMRADLMRAYVANENYDAAIQQFLLIVGEDPQSRFFHLCPLQWVATNRPPHQSARSLIKSKSPVEQLIGASWLLASSDREQATKTLERLSRDIEPNIQHFSVVQLWRLRSLNVSSINERQIKAWEQSITTLPPAIRAGPWFVLAETKYRLGQGDAAAIDWLRIPILYPEQLGLSAAALYRAEQLFKSEGRADEATSIRNELQQKFPQSVWSQQRSP